MKLDDNRSKVVTDAPEVVRQAKKQVEYRKVGDHIRAIDGGKVWRIHKESRSVEEALYRESEVISMTEILANGIPPKKIDVEKGYWYVEALNKTNALKKLKQGKIILST